MSLMESHELDPCHDQVWLTSLGERNMMTKL